MAGRYQHTDATQMYIRSTDLGCAAARCRSGPAGTPAAAPTRLPAAAGTTGSSGTSRAPSSSSGPAAYSPPGSFKLAAHLRTAAGYTWMIHTAAPQSA